MSPRTRTALALAAVTALSGAGALGASAQKPPKPPRGGSGITFAASPTIITFGQSVKLSGRVGGAKAGVTVELQRDPFPLGDGFSVQRTTTTASSGNYSFTLPATVVTTYRAVARTAPPQTSANVTVKVRPSVGLTVSDLTPRAGSLVRFSGSVRPAHHGRSVSIQRRSPSGRWVRVAGATLKDAGTTRSTYAKSSRVRSDGTYRVVLAAHADHATGLSRERTLDAS